MPDITAPAAAICAIVRQIVAFRILLRRNALRLVD